MINLPNANQMVGLQILISDFAVKKNVMIYNLFLAEVQKTPNVAEPPPPEQDKTDTAETEMGQYDIQSSFSKEE